MNKYCLETIYKLHTENEEKKYIQVGDDIIGDMLMGKIRNGKLTNITPAVLDVISNFYEIAEKFYNMYNFKTGCKYIVYRGTRGFIPKNNIVIHPIPFSTSIIKENAYNWTDDVCCIWTIEFPLDTRFLCLNNPNEGMEVILPAGTIEIVERKGNELICAFLPENSFEDMKEVWKKF